MIPTITQASLDASFEKVLAILGAEYINKKPCAYIGSDGFPSCLIGYVLADHGVTVPPLHNTAPIADVYDASDETEQTGFRCSSFVLQQMRIAQKAQDCGYSWGYAVNKARTWHHIAGKADWR